MEWTTPWEMQTEMPDQDKMDKPDESALPGAHGPKIVKIEIAAGAKAGPRFAGPYPRKVGRFGRISATVQKASPRTHVYGTPAGGKLPENAVVFVVENSELKDLTQTVAGAFSEALEQSPPDDPRGTVVEPTTAELEAEVSAAKLRVEMDLLLGRQTPEWVKEAAAETY